MAHGLPKAAEMWKIVELYTLLKKYFNIIYASLLYCTQTKRKIAFLYVLKIVERGKANGKYNNFAEKRNALYRLRSLE